MRFVLFCLLVSSLAFAAASPAQAVQPLERIDIPTAQGVRHALVYRSSQPRFAPLPAMVVVLHGAGSDAEQMRALTDFGFEKVAPQAAWVVVYAEGFARTWNDCRRTPHYPARASGVDDVAYLVDLIRTVRERHQIPTGQVLVAGYSNGGHMAIRMALERPDVVDGVLAIGAQLPSASESVCAQSVRAVNTLLIAGTADPVAPYAGGSAHTIDGKPLGMVESMETTAAHFAARAGYHTRPTLSILGNRDGDAATDLEVRRWRSPKAALIELYTVRGGGHAIPQKGVRFPAQFGATSGDIDTATLALEFIHRWPKNAAPRWQVLTASQRAKTDACLSRRASPAAAPCMRPAPILRQPGELIAVR